MKAIACHFLVGNLEGQPVSEIQLGDEVYVELSLASTRALGAFVGIVVHDELGRKVYYFSTRQCGLVAQLKPGANRIILYIPFIPLLDGIYTVSIVVVDARTIERLDYIENATSFRMLPRDLHGSGMPVTSYQGIVHIDHNWHLPGTESHAQ